MKWTKILLLEVVNVISLNDVPYQIQLLFLEYALIDRELFIQHFVDELDENDAVLPLFPETNFELAPANIIKGLSYLVSYYPFFVLRSFLTQLMAYCHHSIAL